MRYAQIRDMDVVNGEGIACSIFFQGCSHHCYNCFNPDTWDFSRGKELTKEIISEFIELCKNPQIDCISILGGEPFDQDCIEFYEFIEDLKRVNKPIYIWSGYTYEELIANKKWYVLNEVDYLIDSKYVDELRDITLWLRGSTNQRIIDTKQSIKQNKIILKGEN